MYRLYSDICHIVSKNENFRHIIANFIAKYLYEENDTKRICHAKRRIVIIFEQKVGLKI